MTDPEASARGEASGVIFRPFQVKAQCAES